MEYLIVGMGVIACTVSVQLGLKFMKLGNGLSHPLALMCFGGALAGACTLVFSISSMFGLYEYMTPAVMNLLRFFIFAGITGTDVYMYLRVRKIERGNG